MKVYETGNDMTRVEVVDQDGKVVATGTAFQGTSVIEYKGRQIKFSSSSGEIYVSNEELVRTATLKDGSVIRVYYVGPNHYRGDIYANGRISEVVEANGKNGIVEYKNFYVKVSWIDGKVTQLHLA
ncbi:hypothetical protein [Streptomyces sp. BPTC-684]|uniref:hypothetical protein n=1 Tax=Streptomyces sp. BPTC-684 TaxID=3043734 RepID=UPI0024B0AAC4|nr:hypothetical protein [Streptomyces sp. BPTC-684]WHM40735.1 hypothetical protein QIY60_30245 [Streptomyces sp. BPTC-684]